MVYPFALDVSLKAAILFAVAWIVTTLAMRRASAASRHLVWVAATCAIIVLPLLGAALPAWRVLPARTEAVARSITPALMQSPTVGAPNASLEPATPSPTSPATPARSSWFDGISILTIVWTGGALACLLPTVLSGWRLRRLARTCAPVDDAATLRLAAQASDDLGLRRKVTLLAHRGTAMPMTWGIIRPTVLLPDESREWSNERRRAVLMHELAHVKRLDCLTHLLGQLARALYWFNPLAWIALWRMSVERERACDDLVLHAGLRQSDYARELLAIGTSCPPAPRGLAAVAMAMARPSRMERRLLDVLDEARNRGALTRRQLDATVVIVLLVTVPTACVKSRAADRGDTNTKPRAAMPAPIPPEKMTVCQENLAILVEAAHQFSYENRGILPPSLGNTLNTLEGAIERYSVKGRDGVDLRPRKLAHPARPIAHYYLCDTDDRRRKAPEKPTVQWLNENTLYRYFAQDVINAIDHYPPDTVMIYEDLNWKGHGDTVNVGFWDGTVRAMDRGIAARAIETSSARIDAIWAERAAQVTGQPAERSDGRQKILMRDSTCMRRVALALVLYARDHDQKLPPTLGDSMNHGDDLGLASHVRAYLLPKDQYGKTWPDRPTPAWINHHTSYTYLADGADVRKLPKDPQNQAVLFHTRLDKPLKGPDGGDVVLLAFADGHVELFVHKGALPVIEKSRKTLEAAR